MLMATLFPCQPYSYFPVHQRGNAHQSQGHMLLTGVHWSKDNHHYQGPRRLPSNGRGSSQSPRAYL